MGSHGNGSEGPATSDPFPQAKSNRMGLASAWDPPGPMGLAPLGDDTKSDRDPDCWLLVALWSPRSTASTLARPHEAAATNRTFTAGAPPSKSGTEIHGSLSLDA